MLRRRAKTTKRTSSRRSMRPPIAAPAAMPAVEADEEACSCSVVSVSHSTPVNPETHMQVKASSDALHVPPLRHGEFAQRGETGVVVVVALVAVD